MPLNLSTTLEFKITNTSPIIRIPLVKGELLEQVSASLEVDWGDGSAVTSHEFSDNTVVHMLFHKYSTIPGNNIVTVKIYGGWGFSGKFGFCKSDERPAGNTMDKLYKVKSQENLWIHGQGDFKDCVELVSLNKVWGKFVKDGNQKFELIETFAGCTNLESGVGDWKLDGCTKLEGVFKDTQSYQEWIRGWKISEVTSMKSLFEGSTYDNTSICGWAMTSVEDTSYMFKNSSFSQWINTWFPANNNSLSIQNISGMFEGAAFNSKLSDWNLKTVTDASYCFKNHQAFTGGFSYIESWFNNKGGTKTFNIQNIKGMFEGSNFNNRLANWDVTTVTDASDLFKNNTTFNKWIMNWFKQPAGGGKIWAIDTIAGMFEGANAFVQKLSNWDLTTVKDMSRLFKNNTKYNGWIKPWLPERVDNNTPEFRGAAPAAVEHMDEMFAGNTAFNQKINTWDVRAVKTAAGMFKDNTKFTQFIGTWFDTTSGPQTFALEDTSSMFEGSIYNNNLSKWNMKTVKNVSRMFADTTLFDQYVEPWFQKVGGTIPHAVENVSGIFEGAQKYNKPTGKWDLRAVTDASNMFKDTVLFNQTVDNLFKSADGVDPIVENISGLFDGAAAFNQEITSWNLSTVKDASKMFANNTKYNQWMNTLFASANVVEDVSGMFENSNYNGVLSNWIFHEALDASDMFKNNTTFNQYIEPMFNSTSARIEDLSGMFEGATSFNKKITNWKPANAITLKNMFKDSAFNGDIGDWFKTSDKNVPSPHALKDLSGMFSGTSKYGQNNKSVAQKINQWDVRTVETIDNMFNSNDHFDGWMRNWNSGNAGGLKNIKTIGDFATKAGWNGMMNQFIDDVEQTYDHVSTVADIVNTSVTTGTITINDIHHDLFVNLSSDPFVPTPGMVRVGDAPPSGDLVLEVDHENVQPGGVADTLKYTYTMFMDAGTDITIPVSTSFSIIYTGDNRLDQTIDLSVDSVAVTGPAADPIEVEFRWHDVTVSIAGEDETVKVLQVKNALEPTHVHFSRDMTQWWTVYGYTGSASYDLDNVVWADVAVATNYADFHPGTITLPDDGGTITFQADGNTGYLQANFTPGSDYEFYDEAGADGQLYMFNGESSSDSASHDAQWPWPVRKTDSAPVPLVAGPQTGVTTPPGTVTGDLTKDVLASPSFTGGITGSVQFVDNQFGSSYANSDINQYYVSVENITGPDNYTGNVFAEISYDYMQNSMQYYVYTDDYASFRGDISFDIVWPNDVSADLLEQEMNGNIPGAFASYSDTTNGVYLNAYNEGSDYNFSVTADGIRAVWELIRDLSPWGPDGSMEMEFDMGMSTDIDDNNGYATYVYPTGTVITTSGGSDGGSLSSEQHVIAYNQMNRAEIRVRVSEPAADRPGTATGDTDVNVLTNTGRFLGTLTFTDDDGTDHLSDLNYGGWYSAGSTQVAGPVHNISGQGFGLSLRTNSLQNVGQYDYMVNDQIGAYVDEYDITWYDDAGYMNTTRVKINVTTPPDVPGQWMDSNSGSTDISKNIARNWSGAEYNDNPSDPWGYMQGDVSLYDQNGLYNNSPSISTQPTGGTASINSSNSGQAQWTYTPTNGNVALAPAGDFTDSFEINWQDDQGNDNKQIVNVTIEEYDPANQPAITGGNVVSVDAWSTYHPTNNSQTYAYINLIVSNLPTGASIVDGYASSPNNGYIQGYNTSFSYSPYEDVSNTSEVLNVNLSWYNFNDYSYGTITGTINITINELPAVQDQLGSTSGDITGSVNMNTQQNGGGNYISGKTLYYSDPNGVSRSGDPETISIAPTKGVANISYGQWEYTPNNDQIGQDTFTVQWTDDADFTNTQLITVTIVDTSDKASTITGALSLTAIERAMDGPADTVTGTITIHDPNGLTNPNLSTSDYNTTIGYTSVNDNTIEVEMIYTPQPGVSTEQTVQLQWTDDQYYSDTVNIPVTFTRPAIESSVNVVDIGGTSQVTEWTFNNIDNVNTINFNDIIIKANNGLSNLEIADTDSNRADSSDDKHQFLNVTWSSIAAEDNSTHGAAANDRLYKVNVKADESFDWSNQSPIVSDITGAFTLKLTDGYNRQQATPSDQYTYTGTAFEDQLGTSYLEDVTDPFGQTVSTDSEISSITLFHPAPMGNGITANIIFDDVGGVNNSANTMTVTNVDSNSIEVIPGFNINGGAKLEMTGQGLENDGSFSVEWQDDRGVMNTSTFTYQVISLPDVPGELQDIEMPNGDNISANNGVYTIPAENDPIAFTVSVQDANGVGAPSNIIQPSKGTATVVESGGHYLVTYTPPANLWFEDTLQFDWADGDGNSNGTVTINFAEAIDPPSPNDAGSAVQVIDENSTKALYSIVGDSGETINFKLIVHDPEGLPVDDAASGQPAIFYDQPVFTDALGNIHSAGSVSITLAADQTIPVELLWSLKTDPESIFYQWYGSAPPMGGQAGASHRIYNVSITLPTVTVTSNPSNPHLVAEELLLDISTRIAGYDYYHYLTGAIAITPYQMQVSVLGNPGPNLILEYSEPVDISHLPTHDGSSSITGNVVTITGATNFGAASDASNSDKTAAASKLVRVQSFGRAVTNWDYAFKGSSNLTSIPLTLKGAATSMKSMFADCTGLTNVDADSWITDSVTSMESMFSGCTSLIKLYADWNTSNVTNFNSMFAYTGFANITDIVGLFPNSPTGWDFSSATTFADMFKGSTLTSFNWTNTQFGTGITDFSGMFKDCTGLVTANITNLDLTSATNVSSMFEGCTSLTSVTGLGSTDTTNVENFGSMFKDASAIQSISMGSQISTVSATDLTSMFEGTGSLTTINGIDSLALPYIQPSGLTNMFKDSGVVNAGTNVVDISSWSAPNLITLPTDMAGGASLDFLKAPLSIIGGGEPIVPPTVSYAVDSAGSSAFKLSDYKLPDNNGSYWDWRNPNSQVDTFYFVAKLTHGGQSQTYLLDRASNSMPDGLIGNQYYNYELYLRPVFIKKLGSSGHQYVHAGDKPADWDSVQMPLLLEPLQPLYYPTVEFIGVGDYTKDQLNNFLPTDESAMIDVEIKLHDAAGRPTIDITTGQIAAEDVVRALHSTTTRAVRTGEDVVNNNNTVRSAIFESTPYRWHKAGVGYIRNNDWPGFDNVDVEKLTNGDYDSTHTKYTYQTVNLIPFAYTPYMQATLSKLLNSSLTPELTISRYDRVMHAYNMTSNSSSSYTVANDSTTLGDNATINMKLGDQLQLSRQGDASHPMAVKNSDGDVVANQYGTDLTFAPTSTGTYQYYCTAHPLTMVGNIVVGAATGVDTISHSDLVDEFDYFNSHATTNGSDPYRTEWQHREYHTIGSNAGQTSGRYEVTYLNGVHPDGVKDDKYYLSAEGEHTLAWNLANKYNDHVSLEFVDGMTAFVEPTETYIDIDYTSTDKVFIPRLQWGMPGSSFDNPYYTIRSVTLDFDPDNVDNLPASERYYTTNLGGSPIVPTGTTGVDTWHTANWDASKVDISPMHYYEIEVTSHNSESQTYILDSGYVSGENTIYSRDIQTINTHTLKGGELGTGSSRPTYVPYYLYTWTDSSGNQQSENQYLLGQDDNGHNHTWASWFESERENDYAGTLDAVIPDSGSGTGYGIAPPSQDPHGTNATNQLGAIQADATSVPSAVTVKAYTSIHIKVKNTPTWKNIKTDVLFEDFVSGPGSDGNGGHTYNLNYDDVTSYFAVIEADTGTVRHDLYYKSDSGTFGSEDLHNFDVVFRPAISDTDKSFKLVKTNSSGTILETLITFNVVTADDNWDGNYDVQKIPGAQQANQAFVEQHGFNNIFAAFAQQNVDMTNIAEKILNYTGLDASNSTGLNHISSHDHLPQGNNGQYFYTYQAGSQKNRKVRIYYDQVDLDSGWDLDAGAKPNMFVRSTYNWPSYMFGSGQLQHYQGGGMNGGGDTIDPGVNEGKYERRFEGFRAAPFFHWAGTLGEMRAIFPAEYWDGVEPIETTWGRDISFNAGEYKNYFLDIATVDMANADTSTQLLDSTSNPSYRLPGWTIIN